MVNVPNAEPELMALGCEILTLLLNSKHLKSIVFLERH